MLNKETALVWKLVCMDEKTIQDWKKQAAAVDNDAELLSSKIRDWLTNMSQKVDREAEDVEHQFVEEMAQVVDWDLISRSIIYSLQPPVPKEEVN
ncbi:hypothetical protein [Persicobacter sp. CCB-QB2]|uniref:hypothetical protein n=1 Tax=Persicobacter sp. CCB-QB2 TaxID=1561025 RepID=UPI0006A9C238|nr:hypothetical protein [Persicobacter sp. CCB-QB2]